MLEAVKEKEREKILSRTMGNHEEAFTKAVIHNFSKLIKDARRIFFSKVEGAQLLLKIFGAKLDETDFQIWLAEVLRLKDRDELFTFMSIQKKTKQRLPLDVENFSAFAKGSLLTISGK